MNRSPLDRASARRRLSALGAACAFVLLGGCGGSSTGSATSPARAAVSVSGQQIIDRAEAVIPPFCKAPAAPPPAAVAQSVSALVALLRREPDAVVGGAVFAGKTVRDVLADFGGLLNTRCAPALGSRVAQALGRAR